MGEISDKITEKIVNCLAPVHFELVDESDRHRGHAGHDGRGESHFRMLVISHEFSGKSRAERHRMVYEALKDLMGNRIHALSISARTPDESSPEK